MHQMSAFKIARLEAGLTVQQIADQVGVTCSAVSAWERGVTSPNAKKIPKLAKTLKKSPLAIIEMFSA